MGPLDSGTGQLEMAFDIDSSRPRLNRVRENVTGEFIQLGILP